MKKMKLQKTDTVTATFGRERKNNIREHILGTGQISANYGIDNFSLHIFTAHNTSLLTSPTIFYNISVSLCLFYTIYT